MRQKLRQFFGAFGIDMNHFSIERTGSGHEELYYLESKKGFTAASRYPLVYFETKALGDEKTGEVMRVELPNKKQFVLVDLANESYAVTAKTKFQLAWHFFDNDELNHPERLVQLIKKVV